MADYTITVSGVDQAKLKEAVDIAVEAVRGALQKAGLGDLEVTSETAESTAQDDTAAV
jgi:F420-0:gamma-glutamyl ligase-like protein